MIDSYRHKGQRKKLVETLKEKGITDDKVLQVINDLPRHFFIPDSALHQYAYEDKAFPIGAGQTISQPYTVAFQTQLLEIKKGDKVLEIGTGSGYQAAVLFKLGAKVFSIERQKALYDKTKPLLEKMGIKIKMYFGDGYKGLPAFAPFDKIIITAAAPLIPQDLLKQLKPGGILVIPLGEGDTQVMKKIIKNADGSYEEKNYGLFKFVPMLKNKAFNK
jgi:protein-L-isoaspartate(D-aspartate) O-methyltransferase